MIPQPSGKPCFHCSNWLAHPGELAAAETYTQELQQFTLVGLPGELQQRVVCVATAHTDVATFLHSQPTLEHLPGELILKACT